MTARRFWRHAIGAVALLLSHAALAATGYQALDNAAVTMKFPQRASMVAIVLAGHRLIAAGVHGVIIFSDDDGRTWRQSAVPVDVTITSMYFETATEGWATGHYGVVLHSTDAGVSWQPVLTGLDVIGAMNNAAAALRMRQPDDPAAALQTRVARFFADNGPDQPFLTVGPCGHGILAAGAKNMGMFSADDGRTWQDWTPRIANPHFRMIYGTVKLGSAPILLGETGWLAIGDAECQIFRTLPPSGMPTLFGGLALSDHRLLVYGLNGTVATSQDAGTSWQQAAAPAEEIFTAGIVTRSGGIILGALSGALYIGRPDGSALHRAAVSLPYQIAALALTPNGNLAVAGNGGVAILPGAALQ